METPKLQKEVRFSLPVAHVPNEGKVRPGLKRLGKVFQTEPNEKNQITHTHHPTQMSRMHSKDIVISTR